MSERVWNKAEFKAETNVPRGTMADFEVWNELLIKWNKRINLVAPNEIGGFWGRHAFDSWQLVQYLPANWQTLVDLGSGGGFPGLAMGIHAKAKGEGQVHLVESVGKKASFLKSVTRDLNLPVTVHGERIESLAPLSVDVLTARAFAPLPQLFKYAAPHLALGAVLILPKGAMADAEVEAARAGWSFTLETFTSQTDAEAKILRVTQLQKIEPQT